MHKLRGDPWVLYMGFSKVKKNEHPCKGGSAVRYAWLSALVVCCKMVTVWLPRSVGGCLPRNLCGLTSMQGHCVSLHCLNCGHGCGLTSTQGHCVSLQSSDHSHGTSYPSLFTVRCGIYLSADFGCSAFFAAEIATQYSKNNTANIWFPREPPRTAMNDGAISTDTAASFFGIPMYQRCPDIFFQRTSADGQPDAIFPGCLCVAKHVQ